jgi:hypothetical protein
MSDCITHIFHYMQVNGFYQALLPLSWPALVIYEIFT